MDVPAILREIATRAKVKQTGLSEIIGVTQPQISRYMKGAEPKAGAYEKIMDAARRFGVADDAISSEDVAAGLETAPRRTIKVKGYVGAGNAAHYYAVSQGDLEEIPASDRDPPNAVAVVVIGTSMGKLLEGWYVIYDDVRNPVTADLNGELCVVGLSDDRILVKRIKSAGKGLYDLISETEEPIRNVRIDWAAKVAGFRPK